ncbi:SipW-dependent-type signal peptide-containing protein [Arthrobacter sp. B1805]|uniref:SipW-dependent-type signal peptide-containing protein n=1 Tax=Arthrobacter sp. B1805 TaxID=2058892 RepID=UPI0015E439E1|nr:SipW-dependent-type signal peptide-containing protein [Arthrobacter sp. B1805]
MGAHSVRRPARATRAARPKSLARIRAVLAGALVLGVGGSLTLASWTDTEYASGSFAASSFSIESTTSSPYSADGPWTINETAPGATLSFNATGMYPGSTAYAPIALRTRTGSLAGTASLGPAAVTNPPGTAAPLLGDALVYRVVRSETCSAAVFASGAVFVVGSATAGRPLTTGQNAGVVNSLAPATPTAPGASTRFCFEVSLPPGAANALQGKSASAIWQFSAVSTAP